MRFRRIVLAVSVSVTLLAIAATAGPAAAATSGACPANTKNFVAAGNVAASFSNNISTNTTTYFFQSLDDESSVGGVPGLIKYCVYPTPTSAPTKIIVDPDAVGADGELWTFRKDSKKFSFVRPDGNPSNIPLNDGAQITMGTATWTTLPATQTILLHINDPTECSLLYGDSLLNVSGTCFVKPFAGPICDAGAGAIAAAYNNIPFDVVNCGPPSWGFEARQTNELGQEVHLAKTGVLDSLNVSFNSYACSVSGQWNHGNCVTTAGAVFTLPITAKIYAANTSTTPPSLGALLATSNMTFTDVPYRPSAEGTAAGSRCPDGAGGDPGSAWYNPAGQRNPGGGALYGGEAPTPSSLPGDCEYSAKKVLSFTTWNSTPSISGDVIWTVAFNTTHYGYTPFGDLTTCFTTGNPGCPYDSFNLGTLLFPNAPYVGTIPDPTAAWISIGNPAGTLLRNTTSYNDPLHPTWAPFPPLGEVITK